ncbi:MAG: hypothetical protein AB1758_28235 [Candidatus Eremiobacterota bacterium]
MPVRLVLGTLLLLSLAAGAGQVRFRSLEEAVTPDCWAERGTLVSWAREDRPERIAAHYTVQWQSGTRAKLTYTQPVAIHFSVVLDGSGQEFSLQPGESYWFIGRKPRSASIMRVEALESTARLQKALQQRRSGNDHRLSRSARR